MRIAALCVGLLAGTILVPARGSAADGPTEETPPADVRAPAPDDSGRSGSVRPGQTIRGLLDGEEEGSGKRASAVPADWTVFLKLGLGSVSLALVGAGLVFVYRRWLPGGNRTAGEGDLKVSGRVALSPRHLVYLLEVEGRKVVVGVSGDRMTSLGILEEPRGRAAATHRGPPASPRLNPTAPARALGEAPGRAVSAADLMPYRRQVNRLREMLRRDGADIRGEVDAT